jgi:hypothetical protein
MNLKELKMMFSELKDNQIYTTKHAKERIQDKRRKINYAQLLNLIKTQRGLYKFEEQKARNEDEQKFKIWFRLNYLFDMNIYVVLIFKKEKSLNMLEIISAHKVKRRIQKEIKKWQ